jgi:hypothetical protein
MANQTVLTNLIGGSRKSNMAKINSSFTMNMYSETQGEGASSTEILRSIFGTSVYLEMPEEKCRGIKLCSFGQDREPVLFAVFGTGVYVIRKDGPSCTKIGQISSTCIYVSMCETGGQGSAHPHLVVVDGTSVFAVDTSFSDNDMIADWRSIELPKNALDVLIKPTHCAYIKGFLLVNDILSDGIYKSFQYPFETLVAGTDQINYDIFMLAEYNGYGWVTYSELSPDALTSIISTGTDLWTFGPRSYQVWTWKDDVNQPITPLDTTAEEIGIRAPYSVAMLGPMVFWLGASDIGQNGIYVGKAGTIVKISNPDIEREISGMTYPEDALGQCWSENGHEFYAITFFTDNKTFVYDLLEKQWHNRCTREAKLNVYNFWEPQFGALAYNKLIFGTLSDKYLIFLDPNSFEEYDGRNMIRLRESGFTLSSYSPMIIESFQLIANNGFINDISLNPRIMLRCKRDGGSYSNVAQRRLGRIGQYDYQSNFDRLGIGRLWSFEISYSEKTDFVIINGKILSSQVGRF